MMSLNQIKPCPCGSGKDSQWKFDGNGIPLFRVCPDCRASKLAKVNPCVLQPYTCADVDCAIEEEDRW